MALHAVLLLLCTLIIIYLPVFDLSFFLTDVDEEQTGSKEAVNVTLSDMDYLKKKVKSEGELDEADQKVKAKAKRRKNQKGKTPKWRTVKQKRSKRAQT